MIRFSRIQTTLTVILLMMAFVHKIKLFSVLLSCGLAITLSACSSLPKLPGTKTTKRDPQVVASPDTVSLMLAEAADKASDALETLASVEQSKAPAIAVQPIHNAPLELKRAITITWVGPAEGLVRKLADRASYTFISLGDKPPIPLTVNIDAENKPIIDVLRDAGLQLGMRADIKVDGVREVVELHYAPVPGMGR